jgi:hypothetical protein
VFVVLYFLPVLSAGIAVLGLLLLPWRRHRRFGAWLLLAGLAVTVVDVLALFQFLGTCVGD